MFNFVKDGSFPKPYSGHWTMIQSQKKNGVYFQEDFRIQKKVKIVQSGNFVITKALHK